MFEHQVLLNQIEDIEIFFKSLGLIKKHDLPDNWNLDSNIKYTPKDFKFKISYNDQLRILISIDINIVSGLVFTFSGEYKKEISPYEVIHTDYHFKQKYSNHKFFVEEWRDYKLNSLFENEIN